jgi:hypothetical protein
MSGYIDNETSPRGNPILRFIQETGRVRQMMKELLEYDLFHMELNDAGLPEEKAELLYSNICAIENKICEILSVLDIDNN